MKERVAIVLFLFSSYILKAQEDHYSFSLNEAVTYAMTHNYTVRNAALDIEAA